MQARELEGISTGGRGGSLKLGKTKTRFKFLAPPEILEMHNHDWTEYASLSSRLLEKLIQAKNMVQHGKSLFNQAKTAGKKVISNFGDLQGTITTLENAALGAHVNVPARKVDTPLAYSNSQRRQLQFEFTLADNRRGRDVVKTVKLLQSFAAARNNDVLQLEFPHIFKVATEPEGLILYEQAAMTSIQPTWLYPFIDGYPTRCQLTVAFTDMSPLFQKTITEGTIINVTEAKEPSYDGEPKDFSGTKNLITSRSVVAPAQGRYTGTTFHHSTKYSDQSYDDYRTEWLKDNPS
jgi:hypothetical protein